MIMFFKCCKFNVYILKYMRGKLYCYVITYWKIIRIVLIKQNFCAEKKKFLHHVKIIPGLIVSMRGLLKSPVSTLRDLYTYKYALA